MYLTFETQKISLQKKFVETKVNFNVNRIVFHVDWIHLPFVIYWLHSITGIIHFGIILLNGTTSWSGIVKLFIKPKLMLKRNIKRNEMELTNPSVSAIELIVISIHLKWFCSFFFFFWFFYFGIFIHAVKPQKIMRRSFKYMKIFFFITYIHQFGIFTLTASQFTMSLNG